jgi:hypothetical protein
MTAYLRSLQKFGEFRTRVNERYPKDDPARAVECLIIGGSLASDACENWWRESQNRF